MQELSITVKTKTKKDALTEGARELGVEAKELQVTKVDGDTYTVSLKNAPGQLDILVREDNMAAVLKIITPPLGDGEPLTTEDVEQALADLGIEFGIDGEKISEAVAKVAETGTPQENIPIAEGKPPIAGEAGKIEMKIGRDAPNSDPWARNMVKPGQIIAVMVPATEGSVGRNIHGQEVPAERGADAEFSAGENVTIAKDGLSFISTVYGAARETFKDVSVTDLVKVDPDGMWAEMPITPVLADNSRLTVEDMTGILKQAGVKQGIKEDTIKEALEGEEAVENCRVAEGTPAKDGVDAKIEFQFQLNGDDPETVDGERNSGDLEAANIIKDTVNGGDVLAKKIPVVDPVNGRTVTGTVLKGAKPKDIKVAAGENVNVKDDDLTFAVAEGMVVGYADYLNGQLCVEDPLRISEDGLCVNLTVHPPGSTGKALTSAQVEKRLADREVVHGILPDVAKKAITDAAYKKMPCHDWVIAKGKAPKNGQDARIKLKFPAEKIPGTVIRGTDRMDYKEQQSIVNVKKGDVLAIRVPPKEGKEGIDVFGKPIPAAPGVDKKLIPAQNVSLSGDGLSLKADLDGMFNLVDENKIGVLSTHEIPGDVDMNTGNLSMDGALHIKGWVRSGFAVRASGEIHISGGVEDAFVQSTAGVYIKGGIIGSDRGRIQAGGDISVRFLENVQAHADGNLFVRDDIRHSNISVGGNIEVTEGKGRILGGSLEATGDVEAKEIGTAAGIKTLVGAGIDLKLKKRMAEVKKRLAGFKRQRAKMDTVLARYSGKEKKLPKGIVNKLRKLIKARRKTVLSVTRLTQYKEKLAEKMKDLGTESATVKARNAVYPGTTVIVWGRALEIREEILGKVAFVLNLEKKMIETVR